MTTFARPERWLITESISRSDFIRRPSPSRVGHREWLHFSLALPELTLIANVSVVDVPSQPARERARAIFVARDGDHWAGTASRADHENDFDVHGGRVFMRVGPWTVRFQPNGVFVVQGSDGDLVLELELEPRSLPSVASEVPVGAAGEAVNWVVVPELRANGIVTIAGRRHVLRDAPAYHDHNWGYFSHRDFAWEWGHSLGTAKRSRDTAVFVRLLNSAHSDSFMQSLLLWRDGRQSRVFREHEIEVAREGNLRPASMLTVPEELALLAGGIGATGIPRVFHFRASGRNDAVVGSFETRGAARIVVPNEHDLGTTLIHEVIGRFRLDGVVRGARVSIDDDGIFEFLGRGP